MTNISRRSLIKGMAALPLAQHASGQTSCTDNKCDNPPRDGCGNYCHPAEPKCNGGDGPSVSEDTLNVIFHGPFIFVAHYADENYGGYVEVLTPSVQQHVYGGGNWYEEYRLREDTYTLTLPKRKYSPKSFANLSKPSSGTCISRDGLIIICNDMLDDIDPDDDTYCTLSLPFPDAVIPLGTFKGDGSDLGPMLFQGKNYDLVKNIKQLGSAYLFKYVIGELGTAGKYPPQLSNLPWTPTPNILKAYNLHLFAAPTFQFETPDAAAKHSAHSFGNAVGLLRGLDLQLKARHKVKFNKPDPVPGIFGKEQGTLRACIPYDQPHFNPPAICDGPSMFII